MTEIINVELVAPLDTSAAVRLDKQIRLMANSIGDSLEKLAVLVAEAQQGQIHQALGYPSWTAYAADALRVQIRLDRAQRRELVGYLSGEGMSQRVIADVVGVDQKTVSNDLRAGEENSSPELNLLADAGKKVIGRDDKQYLSAPPAPAKPRRRPITDAFWHGRYDLGTVVSRLGRLVDDNRFDSNREAIAGANRADLIRYRDELNGVIDGGR